MRVYLVLISTSPNALGYGKLWSSGALQPPMSSLCIPFLAGAAMLLVRLTLLERGLSLPLSYSDFDAALAGTQQRYDRRSERISAARKRQSTCGLTSQLPSCNQ